MSVTRYIRNLPYAEIRRTLSFIRRHYFNRSVPDQESILIDSDPEEVKHTLIDEYHFESVDDYSFHYDGELVNVRAPWGYNEDLDQMELHIRIFDIDHDKWTSLVMVHLEKSRFEHWHDHINDIGLSWGQGIKNTTPLFDELGIEYKLVRSPVAYKDYHNGNVPDVFKE